MGKVKITEVNNHLERIGANLSCIFLGTNIADVLSLEHMLFNYAVLIKKFRIKRAVDCETEIRRKIQKGIKYEGV